MAEKRDGLDSDTGERVGLGESDLEGDQEERTGLSTFIYRDCFYIWIKKKIPKTNLNLTIFFRFLTKIVTFLLFLSSGTLSNGSA